MRKETGKKLIDMYLDYGGRLVKLVPEVKKNGTDAEARAYMRAMRHTVAYMRVEVIEMVLKQHPDLEPKEWKPDEK